MSTAKKKADRPLLEIDRRARDFFEPHHKTPPIKALKWIGQAGDQLQLRVLFGGVIALGLARKDSRMVGAGVRMLVSHELATLAKDAVKNRIDRRRPRNAGQGNDARPKKGESHSKELTSFPSGHSAGSMAVACALAASYPRHRVHALAAGGLISLAQIPTCSHYPSDVAAGATIGVATESSVGLAWRLGARLWRRWR